MTKTNTPSSRPRREYDYYPTPAWCVHRILEFRPIFPGITVLEPSAGDGSLVRALGPSKFKWTLVESREECRSELEPLGRTYIQDFFSWETTEKFDLCVMNPPYEQAESFIRKSLDCSREVYALLRTGFISATSRANWLGLNMPDIYLLPNRPSFIGTGERDSNDYAWFCWRTDVELPRTRGEVRILNVTPPAERRIPK